MRKFICFAVFLSALKVCSAADFDPFRIDEGSAAVTTVALPAKSNELLNETISKIITNENIPRGSDNILHNNPTPRIGIIGGSCCINIQLCMQLLKILAENNIKATVCIFEQEMQVIERRRPNERIFRSLRVEPGHIPPPADDMKKEAYEILDSELNNQN